MGRTRIGAGMVTVVTLLGVAGLGGTALAGMGPVEVIEVFPGPNALANAVGAADPGDTLNIHAGTYPEDLTITTADLTLQAAGDGKVTVDGGCTTQYTIAVRADGVAIKGIRVVGADEGFGSFPAEIDFSGVTSGAVQDVVLKDTCDAEYGINVFNGGSMTITGNRANGFSDAGIYIGAVTSTPEGPLTVSGNNTFGNLRGIIVEDSAGGTIKVLSNDSHDNVVAGIYVTNSDGVSIRSNAITGNHEVGIHLTNGSDGNLIARNTVSGHTFDLRDDGGVGNCWRNNVYSTSSGDISC